MSEPRASLPIAVFDSGIGGLTVLHELLVSLPHESYLYLGDTAGFPYGTKPQDWLRPRIAQSTRFLLDRGSKLLVVACNSATSAGRGPGSGGRRRARGGGADRDRPRGGDRGGDQRQRPDRGARHADHGAGGRVPSRPRGPGARARGDRGGRTRPRPDHPERLPVRSAGHGHRALLLRAAEARRGRHADPRLHPLPAGRPDAPADARPRCAPGHRRPRRGGRRPASVGGQWPGGGERRRGRVPLPLHGRRGCAFASSAPVSCRCRSARSSTSTWTPDTTTLYW